MTYPTPDREMWSFSSEKWTDLDWAPNLKPDFHATKSEKSKWQCGNPKKLKELFYHFSRHASLHGTHYVCPNRNASIMWRIIHRLFFAFCLLSVIVSVIFLVQESIRKESIYINTINKDFESGLLEDSHIPLFPSITICAKPSYRIDMNESMMELIEYSHLALGYPFPSLTPLERSYLVDMAKVPNSILLSEKYPEAARFKDRLKDLRKKYNKFKASQEKFDLKEFITNYSLRCKDIFVHCFVMVFQLHCCKVFLPVLTSSGICYMMRRNQQLEYVEKKLKNGFSFIVDLKASTHINKPVQVGYQVFLADPMEGVVLLKPSDAHNGVSGFITSLNVKLVKTQRTNLHRRWHGLTVDCPKLPKELDKDGNFGERFTRNVCDKNFYILTLNKFCKCTPVLQNNLDLRPCEPRDLYVCSIKMALKDNLTEMQETCMDPCIEYTYTSEATYTNLGGGNNSRLMISYDAKQFVFNEYQKTTFSSFLSQIGGSLGLYLGASIITAMELLIFIGSWIWYRLIPTRIHKVDQDADLFNSTLKKKHGY